MRATASLALLPSLVALATALSAAACVPKEHPDPDWLKPPKSYDPVGTEGLTFNKDGVDALTLKDEGEDRDAYVQTLMDAKGKFVGQAQCKSGAGTGTQAHSKYGEFELTCTAGTILFDIEVDYHLFTTRERGKPLSANAWVEFEGTLVEFDYHDDTKPRQIVAKVEVGDNLRRLEN
ncbi:hypothetical protein ACNOYE_26275 [Nannocystaceae bacterium ST9]